MTSYRLYPATSGPGASTADTAQYTMGLSFEVTAPGLNFTGWFWWYADLAQDASARSFALWETAGTGAGTYIAGSETTSAALVPGWNFTSYTGTAIELAAGQEYRAVVAIPGLGGGNGYSSTGAFWDTGPGSGGITSGPLTAYGQGAEPAGDRQMVFDASPSNPPDVTANYPSSSFNAANYWLDVQVSAAAPPPVSSGAFLTFF
jgi:hypothetical protein